MSIIEKYYVNLLDRNDQLVRKLNTTSQGKLTFDADQPIQRAGKINIVDDGVTNWIAHRLQIWYERVGEEPRSLGIYIPTAPKAENRTGMRTLPLEIHDKSLIYQDDGIDDYFSVNIGMTVTEKIQELIMSTGETRFNITTSPLTFDDLYVWNPGTPKLEVINFLLKFINYDPLWVNDAGITMVTPYQSPADLPLTKLFQKGNTAIHKANWTLSRELDQIPNRVTLNTSGTGSDEGLTATASNTDPNSPYSIPSIGRAIVHTENVEAESPSILLALAKRRLLELSDSYGIIDIEHLMIPISLGQKVRLVSDSIDSTAIVQRMDINMKPGSMVSATWKEVQA